MSGLGRTSQPEDRIRNLGLTIQLEEMIRNIRMTIKLEKTDKELRVNNPTRRKEKELGDDKPVRGNDKEIPCKQTIRNCTILTTTRPWKMEVIKLTSAQIDAKVERDGIAGVSSKKLIQIMLNHLNEKTNKHMKKQNFISEMRRKKLNHFKKIPVILKQLICVWFRGKPLGQIKCAIYSQMTELLLELGQEKLNEDPKYQEKKVDWISCQIQLPSCFDGNLKCQEFKPLLVALGRLSFYSLRQKNQASSLAIRQSEAEIHGMTADEIEISSKIGILLQNGSSSNKIISYLHKSYQEFLAALFVSTECVQKVFNSKRKCYHTQNMITFISGMSLKTTCTLIDQWPNADAKYSNNWQPYLTECLSEGWKCSHDNKHLLCGRVRIRDDYKPEHLELLFQTNIHNMQDLEILEPPTTRCLEYLPKFDKLEWLVIGSPSSTTAVISEDNLYSLLHNNRGTLTHLDIWRITLRSRTKLSTLLHDLPHLSRLDMICTPMSQHLLDGLKSFKAHRLDIAVHIIAPEILPDT